MSHTRESFFYFKQETKLNPKQESKSKSKRTEPDRPIIKSRRRYGIRLPPDTRGDRIESTYHTLSALLLLVWRSHLFFGDLLDVKEPLHSHQLPRQLTFHTFTDLILQPAIPLVITIKWNIHYWQPVNILLRHSPCVEIKKPKSDGWPHAWDKESLKMTQKAKRLCGFIVLQPGVTFPLASHWMESSITQHEASYW